LGFYPKNTIPRKHAKEQINQIDLNRETLTHEIYTTRNEYDFFKDFDNTPSIKFENETTNLGVQ